MAFAEVQFTAYKNADFTAHFALRDLAGAAMDITAATFRMGLRRPATKADMLELTTENGRIEKTAPLTGNLTIKLSTDDMFLLQADEYSHDLIMTLNGVHTRIWGGWFIVRQGVTS